MSTVTATPVSHPPQRPEVSNYVVGGGGGGVFLPPPNASLYVGDLDRNVTETQLYDLFSQVAPVVSVRVCRDHMRNVSLGYGYVNFGNNQHARDAIGQLNYSHINGKPIRIMLSHRDPSIRKSGQANVFIKNLDSTIDNKALHDVFAPFGTVLSCKVATYSNGKSRGYGFVQFEQEEAAQNAIKDLNKMLFNDKEVSVSLFVRKQERDLTKGSPGFTNVYVKNLSDTVTDDELKKIFGSYGQIDSAVVMKDENNKSRGFGFVNFLSSDSAVSAIEKLNGTTHNDMKWYVGKAQKKEDRLAELKAKFEKEKIAKFEKFKDANLYLKNLDDIIDEAKLKEMFSEFGTITSCKVLVDSQKQSKGCGFVAFTTPEEATKAMNEMNGKMIGRKPLYVAVAQRKEERLAKLQAHFARIRSPGMPPSPYGLSGFYHGGPRFGPQQFYYGQVSPSSIPPQPAGYGFQQHVFTGIRPTVGSNHTLPYSLQRQGQPRNRMGLRRGGTPHQIQQHQTMQRNPNQGFRYMSSARNWSEPSIVPQGHMSPMISFNVPGMPVSPVDAQKSGPVTVLTLSSMSPAEQVQILGGQLLPLVAELEQKSAAKITGMLLEMDQTEVLHLIESPDALRKKIDEARDALQRIEVET